MYLCTNVNKKGWDGKSIRSEVFRFKIHFQTFQHYTKLMFTTQRSIPTYFFGTDPHTLLTRESVSGSVYLWWGGLDWEVFWVGRGFFSSGDGGGEEETPGQVLLSRFLKTTWVSEQSFLCYILYNEQWRFHCCIIRPSWRCPRSSRSWVDTCDVQVSTTWRPLPHTEDSEGDDVLRSVTDSTDYF